MAKIAQVRYNAASDIPNYPNNIESDDAFIQKLQDGTIFQEYYPITQLGIQSLPGTEFIVNGGDNTVVIGATGIYDLDLNGLVKINNLQFLPSSLARIKQTTGGYLIIDILYEGGLI